MRGKVYYIREFVTVMMNNMLLFVLTIFLFSAWTGEKPEAWRYLLYGIIPFLFFGIRKKIPKQGICIIVHILLWILLLCIPGTYPQRLIYGLMLTIMLAYSFYIRTKRESMEDRAIHPAVVIVMIILIQLTTIISKTTHIDKMIVTCTIVYACCYMLCYYLDSYEKFVIANRNSTGYMPEKLILQSGFSIVGIFTVVCAFIFVVCAYITDIQKVTRQIGKWIMTGIFYLINSLSREEITGTETTSGFVMPDYGMSGPMKGDAGIIGKILDVGLVIVTIVLIGAVLYQIIRFIKNNFNKIVQEEMKPDSLHVTDKVETVERISGKKLWDGFHLHKTPQEKIRRIFRSYVSGKCDAKSDKTDSRTAREWLENAEKMSKENKEEFVRIYEKARYSDEECTGLDVKHMLSIKNRK